METAMNTTDLTAAIAQLEDRKQVLTKRADAINDEIQQAAQHTRELGEQQKRDRRRAVRYPECH